MENEYGLVTSLASVILLQVVLLYMFIWARCGYLQLKEERLFTSAAVCDEASRAYLIYAITVFVGTLTLIVVWPWFFVTVGYGFSVVMSLITAACFVHYDMAVTEALNYVLLDQRRLQLQEQGGTHVA